MQDIVISLIQADLAWENIDSNLTKFSAYIDSNENEQDIIILPEMFSTGFTMNPAKVAENMEGNSMQWMHKYASKTQSVITGSLIIEENNNYYNRLIWMKPDGSYQFYNKKHLFTMAGEQNHYTPGSDKLIVEYKGWRICPMICYDLRFPVWIRNKENYDLLIFVANWPAIRSDIWERLLYARAIENQCYLAAVNRIGKDANNYNHDGTSMIISPLGKALAREKDIETMITVKMDHSILLKSRKENPFLADMDQFDIK